MILMAGSKHFIPLLIAVGLAGLAGCSTTAQPASQVTPAPSAAVASGRTTPATATTAPTTAPRPAPAACQAPGAYLTAIRAGTYRGYDRVVFQFSGGRPVYRAGYVTSVLRDAQGTPVPLAGQAFLRVVFRGASSWCPQPPHRTYSGPAALTPFYPTLLAVSAAGDFEGYLSFGVGLAGKASYHAYTLANPARLVIDFTQVNLGRFPGIWDITSWRQYWAAQYAWNNGHQPWLGNPGMVVGAWARSRWSTTPIIQQAGPDTFKVTEPGTNKVDTVTGTRPVNVAGPWVITAITPGPAALGLRTRPAVETAVTAPTR
jgi:hypothetical protein